MHLALLPLGQFVLTISVVIVLLSLCDPNTSFIINFWLIDSVIKKTHNITMSEKNTPEKSKLVKMTVAELKEVLQSHGLSTSGKKADLVERLSQIEGWKIFKLLKGKKFY